MAKKIAVLGSTGSIGRNALRVIDALGPEYQLAAITGHRNIDLLVEQAGKYCPDYVGISDGDKYEQLKGSVSGDVKVLAGEDVMVEIACMDEIDLVIAAVVGAAGLPAILAAAKAGKTIAIANKEPLVIAGQILTETAKKYGSRILPVDSEHCAIFQCLCSGKVSEVSKLILTASGGPFRTASEQEIANATIDDALAHPTWEMGPKITVDSATMMNKALEVIEAKWLFGVDVDKIDVLIHPESIVHSMVEFVDGSVIAQMGSADMCHPIQYALTWPERKAGITKHLRLDELGSLSFSSPKGRLRRAIDMAFDVANRGGSAPVVFNGANEAAVELFLDGKIKFVDIVELIADCLGKHTVRDDLMVEELLEIDNWARNSVKGSVQNAI